MVRTNGSMLCRCITVISVACCCIYFSNSLLRLLDFNIYCLTGVDAPELLSMLGDVMSEYLPNLSSVHRPEFTRFLTDMCINRYRLFQAVVGGATNMSITQLNMEVQLPLAPCPLAQVMKPLYSLTSSYNKMCKK